ncbi:MAG TPA: LuxR family transcriptional regulator [Xanthobacteraceae bacterium]|nr:LuxR family transcriptional regulator [Xanthobacteraceae bacterium]
MTFEHDEYGKRALDFVQRLQQLTDYNEICRLVVKELEWFGLTHVSSISLPGPGREAEQCILMNTRPREFVERYIEKNYVVRDPVITELRRNVYPFSWGDIRTGRDLSKAEKAIMDEGREFAARDGMTIPIASLSGAMSLFCPCGLEPNLSPRARAALEIIAIYSDQALKRSVLRNQREVPAHTPLTPREREIMQWVAAGKTDEEIADILSIGTTTVTSHVENAKQKLDAFRRTYAVVQALRFGEISL